VANIIRPHVVTPIMAGLERKRANEFLADLPPPVASLILSHSDENFREALLATMPGNASFQLRALAKYLGDTAGGMMEPRVASLSRDFTVLQATTAIRKAPREALHYLYVTERDGLLAGVINMRDLLLASLGEPIAPLIKTGRLSIPDTLPSKHVVLKLRERRFLALPVVDFQGIIAQVATLAVLLSVVAGPGGNTGSQLLAVVMRGLALREIVPGTKRQRIQKELACGIIIGVAVASVTSIAVFAWRALAGDTMTAGVGLALVIGMAMIINTAVAAIAGAVIPLILEACGRDLAQSAAIFLTTVTEIVGFAKFLGFASRFMPMIA